MTVITVSREFGSGGSPIAQKVAQTLGYHFVDKDTIGRVLSQYGLPEFEKEYDAAPPNFWARFDVQRMERRDQMVSLLNQTILALARHGNAVILGRCGFVVLKDYVDVLNVRLQGPLPSRIKYVMERENITDAGQAEAMVKEGDKIRAAFVETFYGARWDAAGAFDVVIDTDKVPTEMAAAWLVAAARALESRKVSLAPTTKGIVPDAVLAAAVTDELKCEADHTK
jgi:cytidylate kinase